jgi:hypothetical protein
LPDRLPLIADMAFAIRSLKLMDKKIDSADVASTDRQFDATDGELDTSYRSLSNSAVASAILAVLGLTYLVAKLLIVLPVMALGLGLVALSSIRKYPEELVGSRLARFGVILSLVVLLGGISWHSYVYMTEVPEGYQRITFRMLKNDKDTDLPFSERALELDGKKVFLKGFVRPGAQRKNLQKFIMVGDFGSCCFGGSPEITDVVAVSIQGEDRVNYGLRVRKIAGTFRLNKRTARTAEKEVPKVYYQIDADIVK